MSRASQGRAAHCGSRGGSRASSRTVRTLLSCRPDLVGSRLDGKVSVIASASEAIQGNLGRPSTSGSPRRFAPRDDEFHSSAHPWKGQAMRIHVINPNTTRSMTLKIGAAAKAAASPGVEVTRRQSGFRSGQHRGLFRRGLLGSRPHRGDRQGKRRRRLRHRLFRRHRT